MRICKHRMRTQKLLTASRELHDEWWSLSAESVATHLWFHLFTYSIISSTFCVFFNLTQDAKQRNRLYKFLLTFPILPICDSNEKMQILIETQGKTPALLAYLHMKHAIYSIQSVTTITISISIVRYNE